MATKSNAARRRRNNAPETSDLIQWAEKLSAEQLLCRDIGHTWTPYRAWKDSKAREFIQVLRCPRCHTERERHISYRGERLAQQYKYEDDYKAPRGTGAMSMDSRAELRLMSLTRLFADAPEVGHDEEDGDEAPVSLSERRKRKAS